MPMLQQPLLRETSIEDGKLVAKRRNHKKLKPDTKSRSWPSDLTRSVLLIRWSTGEDVQEIDLALRAFRADLQIAAHNARDSEDVIAIRSRLG